MNTCPGINIVILGATSHIAKGLIRNFSIAYPEEVSLTLCSTHPQEVEKFIRTFKNNHKILTYDEFNSGKYNALINCTGAGTFKKLNNDFSRYFTITEKYDNLCIDYLREYNPKASYISFSTGQLSHIVAGSIDPYNVNAYNTISKLASEAKHRALRHLHITDIRLYSYFSRYADIYDGYFISDLVQAVLQNKIFYTNKIDIVRDYIHPEDLFCAIVSCIMTGSNGALEVGSKDPVNKYSLLEYFKTNYGLKYEFTDDTFPTATGQKTNYVPSVLQGSSHFDKPHWTSLETIAQETEELLKLSGNS